MQDAKVQLDAVVHALGSAVSSSGEILENSSPGPGRSQMRKSEQLFSSHSRGSWTFFSAALIARCAGAYEFEFASCYSVLGQRASVGKIVR